MSDAGEDTSSERPQNKIQRLQRELSLEIAIDGLRLAGAQVRTEERGLTAIIYVTYGGNGDLGYRGSP